ncbi:hypothetical protein D6833_03755 [Candidatus Parcubacteria bacterium]|nr:MAG: hypothetical protein D6833_03755 [Candidatus Parcubacteria bacterium]
MSWKLSDDRILGIHGPEQPLTPPDEYEAYEGEHEPEPREPDFPPDIRGVQWPYTLDDFQQAASIEPWE